MQLQWKILHRIYPTGTLLFKMKMKDNEECYSCSVRDTIPHFFANCFISRKLWDEAEKKVSSYLGKVFKFNEKNIIIGLLPCDNFSQIEIQFINNVCLIGKLTISKFKFQRVGNILILFENELRIRGI